MKITLKSQLLKCLCLLACILPMSAFGLSIYNMSAHTIDVAIQKKCLNVVKQMQIPPTAEKPVVVSWDKDHTQPAYGEKTCLTFKAVNDDNVIDDKSLIIAIQLTPDCTITYDENNKLSQSSSCKVANSIKPVPTPHKDRLKPSTSPPTH